MKTHPLFNLALGLLISLGSAQTALTVDRATLLAAVRSNDPAQVRELIKDRALIDARDKDLEMPPLGKRDKFPPLSTEEVQRLTVWIDQGAAWPEGVALKKVQ